MEEELFFVASNFTALVLVVASLQLQVNDVEFSFC